ncbi:hypothetical protein PBY51_005706 [Eleginops maclovinus]|uniref:Uncharacterized protein n=1 Tax=Eleginops maclovinus TaxID=56733 RepID=A0AAN8A9P2_ELEMC|nr:hypothetical protein PBY51_005706 [Eleginops maclovinus]
MGRYFHSEVDINSPWFCRLLAALPDPYRLLSRRLLTKRNRLLGGVERIFPPNFSQRGHVLKDSEVDLQNRTLRTRTWNLNHSIIMALLPERPVPMVCLHSPVHRAGFCSFGSSSGGGGAAGLRRTAAGRRGPD